MTDNGILGQIPGKEIASAMHALPDPMTSGLTETTSDRYVERAGAVVRFTFHLHRPVRRGARPFWRAIRADRVENDRSGRNRDT